MSVVLVAFSGLVTGPNGERGVAGAGKDEAAKVLEENGFAVVALADPMKRFCQEVYNFSFDQLWGPSGERNKPDDRYKYGGGVLSYEVTCATDGTRYTKTIREPLQHFKCPTCGGEDYMGLANVCGPKYLTPRHALQQLGTEWGRACYPDTWVDYALRVAQALIDPSHEGYGLYKYDKERGLVPGRTPPRGVVIPDIRFVNEMKAIQKAGGAVIRIKRSYSTLPGYFGGHLSETELLDVPDEKFDYVIENNGTPDLLRLKVEHVLSEVSGRLIPYDDEQKDVPPFKRKK